VGVRVGNFTSDSATLVAKNIILSQYCTLFVLQRGTEHLVTDFVTLSYIQEFVKFIKVFSFLSFRLSSFVSDVHDIAKNVQFADVLLLVCQYIRHRGGSLATHVR